MLSAGSRHDRLLFWGALVASRQGLQAPSRLSGRRACQQAQLHSHGAAEERWREGALAPGQALPPAWPSHPGTCLKPRLHPAEDEREKEAALAALPPGYFSPEFDPVSAELGRLRPAFSEAELEEVVEARAAALEVVSERLSAHVLARYDSFITGVDEVRGPGSQTVWLALPWRVWEDSWDVSGARYRRLG